MLRLGLSIAALAGISLLLWPGCRTSSCEETCLGCCLGDECLSGGSRSACGRGGLECVTCAQTETCRQGSCVLTPFEDAGIDDAGASSRGCSCLTGCCLEDGGCVVGNFPHACGLPRSRCQMCEKSAWCDNGTCTVSACSGCLDPLGRCAPGDTALACGKSGGLCLACVGNDSCVKGLCVGIGTCSAGTCSGGCCASPNACAPPSDAQCGTSGAPCAPCPPSRHCVAGRCI